MGGHDFVAPGRAEELRGLLLRVEKEINRGGPAEEKVCVVRLILGGELLSSWVKIEGRIGCHIRDFFGVGGDGLKIGWRG